MESIDLTKEIALYEEREKNLRDRFSALDTAEKRGLQQGIEKGLQQGLYTVAKKMLTDGADIEMIQRFTGLSKEEILKLK